MLITTPGRLDERREAFARFVNVLRRGIDHLHQHPGAARSVCARRTGADLTDDQTNAIFEATLPCFTHDPSMAPRYYEHLEGWMARRGLIDARRGGEAYWAKALALPAPQPAQAEKTTAKSE